MYEWSNLAENLWSSVSFEAAGRRLLPAVRVYFDAAVGGMLRSALGQMFLRVLTSCAPMFERATPRGLWASDARFHRCQRHNRLGT